MTDTAAWPMINEIGIRKKKIFEVYKLSYH